MKDSKNLYLGESYLLAYGFILGFAVGGHQTIVLVDFFVLFMIIYILYNYQLKQQKKLIDYYSTGFISFLLVILTIIVGWFMYYKYIINLKTNLFVNNYSNTKTGVWGFVIAHLIILFYYLFIRFVIPNMIRRNDFFQRLSFFIVKFLGVFFLGFCVYLYLFIRSHGNPPINWGGISESSNWWEKISKFFIIINRKQFAASNMPVTAYTVFTQFKLVLFKLHLNQFAYPVFIVMFLGMIQLYQKCKFYLLFLLVGFVTFVFQLTLFLNADFRLRDLFFIEVFYIFSYFILSCFVPFGVSFVLVNLEKLTNKISNYNKNLVKENTKSITTGNNNLE